MLENTYSNPIWHNIVPFGWHSHKIHSNVSCNCIARVTAFTRQMIIIHRHHRHRSHLTVRLDWLMPKVAQSPPPHWCKTDEKAVESAVLRSNGRFGKNHSNHTTPSLEWAGARWMRNIIFPSTANCDLWCDREFIGCWLMGFPNDIENAKATNFHGRPNRWQRESESRASCHLDFVIRNE